LDGLINPFRPSVLVEFSKSWNHRVVRLIRSIRSIEVGEDSRIHKKSEEPFNKAADDFRLDGLTENLTPKVKAHRLKTQAVIICLCM
jgi:hypothetical protein